MSFEPQWNTRMARFCCGAPLAGGSGVCGPASGQLCQRCSDARIHYCGAFGRYQPGACRCGGCDGHCGAAGVEEVLPNRDGMRGTRGNGCNCDACYLKSFPPASEARKVAGARRKPGAFFEDDPIIG